jgi:hypothetical protein
VADLEAAANLANTSEALSCAEMMILTLLLLAILVLPLFYFCSVFTAVSVQLSFVLVYHAHLAASRYIKPAPLPHMVLLNTPDTTIQGVLDRLRPGFLVQTLEGFERLLG